jgi:hypothetical protein
MELVKMIYTSSLLVLSSAPLWATNYYVSDSRPDNTGNGRTEATAKKSIQSAAYLATQPGDIVYIMNGTYSTSNSAGDIVTIEQSGSAGLPITYTKYPGHNPIINPLAWNGIKITNGAKYITIDGLTIMGNYDNLTLAGALAQPGGCSGHHSAVNPGSRISTYNGNGIFIQTGTGDAISHHVTVKNCIIYNCPGGGMGSSQADYITLENNIVYTNAKYGAFGGSGISNLSARDIDNNTTDYKMIVRNNIVYDNEMFVPWYGYNCEITDGNGIIFDSFNNTGIGQARYEGKSLCENNVTYSNGGRGIHVFQSRNVTVINNTSYQNCKSSAMTDGDMTARKTHTIKYHNNIIYARSDRPITNRQTDTNTVASHNLYFGGNGTTSNTFGGSNNVTTDPKFTNAANGNFTLLANSPAINAGTNTAGLYSTTDILGIARPYSTKPDIGAYESIILLPITLVVFKGFLADNKAVLQWLTASEKNAQAFIVEKSTNGKDFTGIGTVAAKNKSEASSYTFDDNDLNKGINYYRLKMVDLDGTFVYSKVVSVASKAPSKVKIYPSVSNGNLTVEGAKSFDIVNLLGQVVFSETDAIHHSSFTLHHLNSGIYVVRGVDTEGSFFLEKIVKQ